MPTNTGKHFISLRIINKSGKTVTLMPNDNNPSAGYIIKLGTIATFVKTNHRKPACHIHSQRCQLECFPPEWQRKYYPQALRLAGTAVEF